MTRQVLLGTLIVGLFAVAFPVDAQRPAPMPRIGFLGMDSQMQAVRLAAFQDGLRALGYIEGRNIAIEYRWAEGRFERLPELASQLVALNVEVIVTAAPPSVAQRSAPAARFRSSCQRTIQWGWGSQKALRVLEKHHRGRFPGLGAVRQTPGAVAADGPEARRVAILWHRKAEVSLPYRPSRALHAI